MQQLTIYLDDATARALRWLAAERQSTQSQIAREAVADYLLRYSSRRTDVPQRANVLLRRAARAKVRVPLICSKQPGRRNLTNPEIEELLS